MTDRAQFEAMLEALINDDQAAAKEIFHNIVVGKSREIYEELLAEDFSQDQGNPYAESSEEEEESMEEESVEEEGAEEESADDEEGEEADDAEDSEDDAEDEEDPFAGDEEGEEGEGDIEDRVMDLEDALEDLKAEFEQLMASEEGEEEHADLGGDDIGADMAAEPSFGDEEPVGEIDELASLMEYVNKVSVPSGGDNGTNTKSTIDNMKNDMGGTTANMTKSFSTTTGGTEGGLASTKTQPQDGGNVNVPGAKNATKLKPVTAGHGAEKAGKKETADNKQSFLKQAKK